RSDVQSYLHFFPARRSSDLGWVQDLDPLYAGARVTIAPLRFGAGVKGKVGESLGKGVPVVGTSVAVEGMWLEPGTDVLVADGTEEFAAAIGELLADDAKCGRSEEHTSELQSRENLVCRLL